MEEKGARKRTLRLTGRQTFLLEQIKPPTKGFHETRDTNHGLFLACFGRRVVRKEG